MFAYMKQCTWCKQLKPLSEFYDQKGNRDGKAGRCKDCSKKSIKGFYDINKQNPDYIEKERNRGRDKFRRIYAGAAKAKPAENAKWMARYPEKRIASLRSARLKKPFDNAEKHHWSYDEKYWLDVIFLTKKHHMKAHRFLVYDQERKMYRRYDTMELLDTKERHEVFIKHCIENKED